MARLFLSRADWPLITAGVLAGLVTFAFVLYLFVTGIDGGQGSVAEMIGDTATATGEEPRPRRDRPVGPEREVGAVIGAREAGIRHRLDALEVSTRPLAGPLSITMRDVVWTEPGGGRFARAASASGRLDTRAAQRGDVIISDVVLNRPVVAVRQDASGEWNYEVALAELLDGDGNGRGGRKRTVQLRGVRIENGDVEVTRPGQRFAFRAVQARMPLVVFSQEGVADPYLRLEQGSARFVQAEPEADLTVGATNGLFRFPDGTVEFEVAAASLDETRFADLDGVWDPAQPGFGVTATGRALAVDLADVAFLTPESFPETGSATFTFAVRPVAPDGTEFTLTELDATSGGSRVRGALTGRFGADRFELLDSDLVLGPLELALVEGFTGPLPYGGSVSGTVRGTGGAITFDVVATLTTDAVARPFTTDLTGRVTLTDTGFALERLDVGLDRVPLAALRAMAPGLPLSGTVTGTVTLAGMPSEAPLAVDVRLELGAGVALVGGKLDFTGVEPRYDLDGRILGVDLQAILEPDVPPAFLTARFSVAGTGFDPATMAADVRMAGRFTGWETTPEDTVHVVATVRGGTLGVDTLLASLATARLAASGDWRFVEPQGGVLAYDLAVSSLDPFGPWIPVPGDSAAAGSLRAAGQIAGTLDRMRVEGTAEGTDVMVSGWRAGSLDAEYDLVVGALSDARIVATATDLSTPTAGEYQEAALTLTVAASALDFDLTAVRLDGGLVEIAGSGDIPDEGTRVVRIEQARFDLAEDRWTLLRPATIEWTPEGLVDVDELLIEAQESEGRVRLAGRVLPRGRIDAELEVAAFPTGDIQALFGQPPIIEGMLWAEGSLRGGRENPLLDIEFRVEDGAVQDVPVQHLEGSIRYENAETRIDAVAVVDTAGRLDMALVLPSRLSLDDDDFGFALLDGVPLSGSLEAEQFALAPFSAMSPMVRDLTGFVDASVSLAGTAEAPRVAGTLTLADGAVTVVELNQRYTEITGTVAFDGRELVVQDLRARSDGWATVSGSVVLERLDEPVLDLRVDLDRFRAMGVDDQRDAAVYGTVALTGPPNASVLTGNVRVEDGYVALPEFGASPVAEELADITVPVPGAAEIGTVADRTDWFGNLRIRDLRVTAGDGAWFLVEQARAQLTGELVMNKTGDSFPITGTLQGSRGQYTLVAGPIIRRFEIVSAQVRFRGLPEPNPAIDITARRIVIDQGGRQLDVDVRITGSLENPRLGLASGAPDVVSESELLSFLLFGRPSFALGGGAVPGEVILEQTFAGGFAELAALELERSLGGLGLDIFQVRLGTGAYGGIGAPTFVLGRQLREDVFLTVETGMLALFGEETSAFDAWAVRLDWAFREQARVRLALEPVYRGRSLRSSVLALPLSQPRQQLLLELRRRWTW
jgi:hypothetical protein